MFDGFEVDLDALSTSVTGIGQTVQNMKSCELRDICGESQLYGHHDLHDAFADFCSRWQHGVDVLLEDAEEIRAALGAAVLRYQAAEDAAKRAAGGSS